MFAKKIAVFCLSATCLALTRVHAATAISSNTLVAYTAESSSEFSPLIVNGLITATGLGLGNSLANLQPGVSVPSSVFLETTSSSSTPAAAVTNKQFLQFTVSPISGFLISPGALSLSASSGGSSSPRGWALTSSLNNFSSIIASSNISTVQPSFENFTIDLTAFGPIANSAVFRIHLYAPAAGNGIFLDNIAFSGAIIPEPAPVVLGSISVCFALMLRIRKTNSVFSDCKS